MGHKVKVHKVTTEEVEVEIPAACPHCRRPFDVGGTDVVAFRYAPIEETVRLITVLAKGTEHQALDFKKISNSGDRPTLTLSFHCLGCRRRVTPNLFEEHVQHESR
jgi:hypothetical protein